MVPNTQARKKRNSSKVNLAISFTVHALLVVLVLYFAARQGWLGEQAKKISVSLIKEAPKPKPPEVKPPPPPPEVVPPKVVEAPRVESPKAEAPAAPPTVAPPAQELPSFDFGGGKEVISSSDPVQLYKSSIEYAMRSRWDRPDDMDDDSYVVEVQVDVGRDGSLSNPVWEKGSGNKQWDDSVRAVITAVTSMDRPPPTNFPPRVTIRFDVQDETEPLFQ
jgi:TonB C terminal